jgi:hypothetical protein
MKLALNGIVIVALIVDEEDEILEDAGSRCAACRRPGRKAATWPR